MEEIINVTEESGAEEPYKSGAVQYIDSREVAGIVEKNHKNLMRDIVRYSKELTQLNFEPNEYFVESLYKDSTGRTLKCYLVTRKGCEFIAHKMTGIKGTKFTATYINRFHEMEDTITQQMVPEWQQFIEQQMEFNRAMMKKLERHSTGCPQNPFCGISEDIVEQRMKEFSAKE